MNNPTRYIDPNGAETFEPGQGGGQDNDVQTETIGSFRNEDGELVLIKKVTNTGGSEGDQNKLDFNYGFAYKHNFRVAGIGTMFKIGYTAPARSQDFTTGKIKYGGPGSLTLGVGYGPIGLIGNDLFTTNMNVTFNIGPLEWNFSSNDTKFGLNLIDVGAHPFIIGADYKYYLDMDYHVIPDCQLPSHAIPDNTRVFMPNYNY